MANKLTQGFEDLAVQLRELQATKKLEYDKNFGTKIVRVDNNRKLAWTVKARNVLELSFGAESHFIKEFEKAGTGFVMSNAGVLEKQGAVFLAAKESFEGGYTKESLRNLAQAEVFDSELEQATELLTTRYKAPAAVVAGIVLETALRELCTRHNIQHGKLNRMSDDLVKAGVYNLTKGKQITALADIRNNAAHGKPDEFTEADVKSMIEQVERFVLEHLA